MTFKEAVRPSHHASPLRYPGGKAKLAAYFKAVVRKNRLLDCTYAEPFAGGGGVGLALLLHGYVDRIVLNDLSAPIYAFWRALLDDPGQFKDRILNVALSPDEWERQREIFRSSRPEPFDLGFAAFYLNRTNHSGVLNGGMIGGYSQSSTYGIDARFNRSELSARVERIARQASRIRISRLDAAAFLANLRESCGDSRPLLYIDPPYYEKGRDLYYDFYRERDHEILRDVVVRLPSDVPWVVSYDNVPAIRQLYRGHPLLAYNLSYSVRNGRVGREVMFFSSNLSPAALAEGGLEEMVPQQMGNSPAIEEGARNSDLAQRPQPALSSGLVSRENEPESADNDA